MKRVTMIVEVSDETFTKITVPSVEKATEDSTIAEVAQFMKEELLDGDDVLKASVLIESFQGEK
ncbi:MAG: hypothetical protein ACTSU7_06980 [Candidatus Heimdallarchaeaceae archaeon]